AIALHVNKRFSVLFAVYQYPNMTVIFVYPTNGTIVRLFVSYIVNVTAIIDYSYLVPVGNNYLGNNIQWGTGVLINGSKQNTSSGTNTDGKGLAAASSIAANRPWWNYDKNRGEAFILEFSTMGVSTNQLSLQFTTVNWSA